MDTEDISEAFWATKWGAAMRDELEHAPFNPCACTPAHPTNIICSATAAATRLY